MGFTIFLFFFPSQTASDISTFYQIISGLGNIHHIFHYHDMRLCIVLDFAHGTNHSFKEQLIEKCM